MDKKIINEIIKVCDFTYELKDGFCTSISFHNEDQFGSTIRRHPLKHKIVEIIAKFSKLKTLNLRKSKLGYIPKIVSQELEYLDISCNDIEMVPNWIADKPLKFLNLGANKIKSLPDFSNIPLETLKIHKNIEIDKFPKINQKIKSLNLFLLPKINKIPENILDLKFLEVFSFGGTQMNYLPDLPSKLRWLTITINNIEKLPKNFCSLSNLEGLWLAKNKLRFIPDQFGDLKNLRILTLYSNQLKSLPDSFFNLKLNKLNLQCNPLENKEKILSRFKIDFFRI